MNTNREIYVAVIDDQKEKRAFCKMIINNTQGMTCRRDYASVEEALEDLPKTHSNCDIILMDINIVDGMTGVEGTKRFKKIMPKTDIIMLTVHEDEDNIFEALTNGAVGYLVKHYTEPQHLIDAIREVRLKKGSVASAQIARKIFSFFQNRGNIKDKFTPKEYEVLSLLSTGKTNFQIAKEMGITTDGVKKHVKKIFEKLEVENRVQATLKAHGLM